MRNLLLGTVLIAGQALACDMDGKTGILPENNLWISSSEKSINGIDSALFNAVIDRVEKTYAPIVKKFGGNLKVVRNWDDGTVNAYAQQQGSTWMVSMFGGLARHETITADGFALVVCHEIGHHIGGAPKKAGFGASSWASNEGQADYWGTLKCMRTVYEGQDNIAIVKKMNVDPIAAQACKTQFADVAEQAICIRSAMAGHSLGRLFEVLSKSKPIKFETPDRAVVTKTNDNHPASQCRLDTYFSGALCTVRHDVPVSQKEAKDGVCNIGEHKVGTRPLCWYKP